MGRREEPLVKIALAANEWEAGMWVEALRQESIVALARNRDPLGAGLSAGPSAYSIDFYVLASDADRARAILETLGEEPQT